MFDIHCIITFIKKYHKKHEKQKYSYYSIIIKFSKNHFKISIIRYIKKLYKGKYILNCFYYIYYFRMVLNNLRFRYCAICNSRGDVIKKKYIVEIKNDVQINKIRMVHNAIVNYGDIVCLKHINNNKSNIANVIQNQNEPLDNEVDYNNNEIPQSFQNVEFNTNTNARVNDLHMSLDAEREGEIDAIYVNLARTVNSHAYCFICKGKTGTLICCDFIVNYLFTINSCF